MPIPIAEEGEKMDSFIHRCMEDKVMKDEFPVDNQRLAVCNTQWQKKEMSVYVELSEVEVFREGTWNGDEYTVADIDDLVANFKSLRGRLVPKVKITHKENQKDLAGLASYGDVKDVFAKTVNGVKKLFVDLVRVPEQVIDWIRSGRFAERSVEILRNITIEGKKFNNVLARVSFLGHEIPAVPGMKPIELALNINMHEGVVNENLKKYNFIKEEEMPNDLLDSLKTEFKDIRTRIDVLKTVSDEKEKTAMFEKLQNDVEVFGERISEEETAGKNIDKLTKDLTAKESQIAAYKAREEETRLKLKEKDIQQFVSELKLKGQVVPAFESDMKTLLYELDDEAKKISYTINTEKEGNVEQKISLLDFAKKLFSRISKIVEYGEIAPAGEYKMDKSKEKVGVYKAGGQSYDVVGIDEEAIIAKYMLEHKCSLSEATIAVLDAKEKKEGSL